MKKAKKICGFVVEAAPHVLGGNVEWSAWLADRPSVIATRPTLTEARQALADQWEMLVAAYREAGEPVPRPRNQNEAIPCEGDNRRILATIQRLAERKVDSTRWA